MKDIKAYIKIEKYGDAIITQLHSSSYAKEISLKDYMIGFADWCVSNFFEVENGWVSVNKLAINMHTDIERFQTAYLLEIYLKEKGIITE